MRDISGWVVSFIPAIFGGDISSMFIKRENSKKKTGFYIVKEKFFIDAADPYLKGNKKENRPHYYCFRDSIDGVYWVIPLSSQVEKYRKIIERRIAAGKPCDTLHIAKLDNGKDSVFLIQDMFPITDEYIEREYTIAGNHLMVTSDRLATIIDKKARKVASLLRRGIKFTSLNLT